MLDEPASACGTVTAQGGVMQRWGLAVADSGLGDADIGRCRGSTTEAPGSGAMMGGAQGADAWRTFSFAAACAWMSRGSQAAFSFFASCARPSCAFSLLRSCVWLSSASQRRRASAERSARSARTRPSKMEAVRSKDSRRCCTKDLEASCSSWSSCMLRCSEMVSMMAWSASSRSARSRARSSWLLSVCFSRTSFSRCSASRSEEQLAVRASCSWARRSFMASFSHRTKSCKVA
mmetsp:Transcript_16389/g.46780  ORF Transcript_16389/g.46780 Transcript_16389/m.46780 type:complete len:234 (-) Transcript_16389:1761-2462(-)